MDAKNVGGEYKCMAVQENQGSLQEEMFNIRIADRELQYVKEVMLAYKGQ